MLRKESQPILLKDYKVPDYLIEKVDLEFELDEKATTVKSRLEVNVNAKAKDGCKDLILHGEKLELISVTLNSKRLLPSEYKVTENGLTIYNVPQDKPFVVDIENRINPKENTALLGLYQSKGNMVTQCESGGFRRITYFLDRPDVMARYTTKITADKSKYPILISNGNLVEKRELPDGRHWVKWSDPFKKPSYLFALVAGEYELVDDVYLTKTNRKITLQIYTEKGESKKTARAMETLKRAMRWDEDNYGRECDLDVYKIVAISDFNAGAMENKGLNIFNANSILSSPETTTDDDYVYINNVISHEYFHNWTGNRVTIRDFFQLTQKEGLTSFRNQSYSEDVVSTDSRIADVISLRSNQFVEDDGPLARPAQLDSYVQVGNLYTNTVYEKGAELYRMIKTVLGEKEFHKGMDLYFQRHDGQAVTIEDFIKVMQDSSGQDLSRFLLWFRQAGTPILEVQEEYNSRSKEYILKLKQSYPASDTKKEPVPIPIRLGLLDDKGEVIPLKMGLKKVENEKMLLFKHQEDKYYFSDVPVKPVLSLLRGFSAPVKVKKDYNNSELRLLAMHDKDAFNRWDASQQYIIREIKVAAENTAKPAVLLESHKNVATFIKDILESKVEDKQMLARMITLPTEKYLIEQFKIPIGQGASNSLKVLACEVAKSLQAVLLSTYKDCQKEEALSDESDQFGIIQRGRRSLKNVCLAYLMKLNDPEFVKLAMLQFQQSLQTNMTDTLAALKALADIDCKERIEALDMFYKCWHKEANAVNYWFAIQAGSKLPGTLKVISDLLKHESFDIKNPNNVRALLRGFAENFECFHQEEGYALFAKIILQVDAINPDVAAREVGPLLNWKYYSSQDLMRKQLQFILDQPGISSNLKEMVERGLKQEVVKKDVEAVVAASAEKVLMPSKKRGGSTSQVESMLSHRRDYHRHKAVRAKKPKPMSAEVVDKSYIEQAGDAVGAVIDTAVDVLTSPLKLVTAVAVVGAGLFVGPKIVEGVSSGASPSVSAPK